MVVSQHYATFEGKCGWLFQTTRIKNRQWQCSIFDRR